MALLDISSRGYVCDVHLEPSDAFLARAFYIQYQNETGRIDGTDEPIKADGKSPEEAVFALLAIVEGRD